MTSASFALGMAAVGTVLLTGTAWAADQTPPQPPSAKDKDNEIVVSAPLSESERRKQLRAFTRSIIRPPRRGRAIARIRYPICAKVIGLAPADARAIEERIRQNAARFAMGANPSPACTPTVRVAFMSEAAGKPNNWLSEHSKQLAHLPIYQRRRVLAEKAPVRAWSKTVLRDQLGQPLSLLQANGRVDGAQSGPTFVEPFSKSDPLYTSETTGAAVLIARNAAEGLTLAQLADYITMRAFVATAPPDSDASMIAPTILSLFDAENQPEGLTSYDKALLEGIYKAPRNSTPRRVINNIASIAVRAERAPQSSVDQ